VQRPRRRTCVWHQQDLDFVDAARIVGFGNSEGTLHVLAYATSDQSIPFAGLVLAAPPGRPLQTVLLSQLGLQLGQTPGGRELLPKVEEAAARYAAGGPMDPDPSLPESVRMVLTAFEVPFNLPFARELWVASATELLPRVSVPVLVLIGGKDLQIDADADGGPLRAAAVGMPDVTFAFPRNANHVFKEDLRSAAEVAAAPGAGYNEPGTRLDPESVETIVGWLHRVVGRRDDAAR